jgi:hypothetical protein
MLCNVREVAKDGMRLPVAGHGIPAGDKEENDERRRRRWNGLGQKVVEASDVEDDRDEGRGHAVHARPYRVASVALDWASRVPLHRAACSNRAPCILRRAPDSCVGPGAWKVKMQ